jgi:hypothetical protein
MFMCIYKNAHICEVLPEKPIVIQLVKLPVFYIT